VTFSGDTQEDAIAGLKWLSAPWRALGKG